MHDFIELWSKIFTNSKCPMLAFFLQYTTHCTHSTQGSSTGSNKGNLKQT